MFTQAHTRSNAERFDLEVGKLQSLCALHNIPIGTPNDLPGFMRKLAGDRHFAMDFWAFIGTLSKRENGELSDEQMLSVIVEAVAGGDIPEDDQNLKRLVADLANLLAGIDVHGSGAQYDVEAPSTTHLSPPPESPIPRQADEAQAAKAASLYPPPSPPTPFLRASIPDAPPQSIDTSVPPPSAPPSWEDDAFQRLEQKNREMQQYIDKIEARLKRLEPRLEEHIAASKVRIIATGAEGAQKAIEELEHDQKPIGCVRLVLDPDLSTDADVFEMEQAAAAERVPLADYPQDDGHGRLILTLLLLVLLAGAGLFAQRQGVSLRDIYSSLVQKIHAVTAKGNGSSASQSAPNEAVTTPPSSPAVANNSVNPTAPPPSSTTAPPPAATGANTTSTATGTKAQPPAAASNPTPTHSGVANPPAGEKVLSSRSAFVPASSFDELVKPEDRAARAEDEQSAVRVAPGIMASNLFISRVPIYPDDAKASRLQGSVIAQTIIGKDGTVEEVHVLSGDPRLRDAAIEAIQRWRYRPYLLYGKPVPVVTNVTVDFKLNR